MNNKRKMKKNQQVYYPQFPVLWTSNLSPPNSFISAYLNVSQLSPISSLSRALFFAPDR
jgi:hypothetical protein